MTRINEICSDPKKKAIGKLMRHSAKSAEDISLCLHSFWNVTLLTLGSDKQYDEVEKFSLEVAPTTLAQN